MSVIIRAFLLLQIFARFLFVHADVSIVKPTSGASYEANSDGDSVDIEIIWEESADLPSLSSFDYYTFTLLYGTNLDMDIIDAVEEVSSSNITTSDSQYTYTASFSSSSMGDGQFFVQVYAYSSELGYTIHYSPRFNVTSVSGGVTTYTYTTDDVPTAEYSLVNSGIDSRSFTVPYTMQTGIRRYAPMQTQPGTAITVTTWSRKFPTSAVTYYTSIRNSLDQMTTYTPGWSYSRTSDYNYATPAPFPTENGGWYDATDRQTLTTRKLNNKRR